MSMWKCHKIIRLADLVAFFDMIDQPQRGKSAKQADN